MPTPTLESLLLLALTLPDYRPRRIGGLRPAVTGWPCSQATHVTVALADGTCAVDLKVVRVKAAIATAS